MKRVWCAALLTVVAASARVPVTSAGAVKGEPAIGARGQRPAPPDRTPVPAKRKAEPIALQSAPAPERHGEGSASPRAALPPRPHPAAAPTTLRSCPELTKPQSLRIYLFGTPQNPRSPPA
jgi:hypothetical protein